MTACLNEKLLNILTTYEGFFWILSPMKIYDWKQTEKEAVVQKFLMKKNENF